MDNLEKDTVMMISCYNRKLIREALCLINQIHTLLYGNGTGVNEDGDINGLHDDLKLQKKMLEELCSMLNKILDQLN